MLDQTNYRPDVRLMTEDIQLNIAALIRDSARFDYLAAASNCAAIYRINKETRCDVTSHCMLSMQLYYSM